MVYHESNKVKMSEFLRLKRTNLTEESTVGELYLPDGSFQCFVLEDCVRDHKIPGKTAIPDGRYEVVVTWSERFQRSMPLLVAVQFFAGIRIHSGNTAQDTSGCLLVGRKVVDGAIPPGESMVAFEELFPKIKKLTETGKLFIQIEGGIPADKWRNA